jgi:hypothetical protein
MASRDVTDEFVSPYHNDLAAAMVAYRGTEVTNKDIVRACMAFWKTVDEDEAYKRVQASDHCNNHTNKGACVCAKTGIAVFERLGRNRYRVLGDKV